MVAARLGKRPSLTSPVRTSTRASKPYFSTLEPVKGHYVSEDLRDRADDVIWRVKSGEDWLYLYLLIEF